MTCNLGACPRLASRRGWCEMHYRRWLRTGTPEGVGRGRPRRGAATYAGAHTNINRWKGPARHHPCVDCGEEAREWSYNKRDPNELVDVHPFSNDPDYYEPRCSSCHTTFDRNDYPKGVLA